MVNVVDDEITGKFEKRHAFLRRNWPAVVAAPLAALLLLAALGYWWALPAYVRSVVASVEQSLAKLTGTEVVHADVELRGLRDLVVSGLRVGDEQRPLLSLGSVRVEMDPFSFTEGLPAVLLIEAADVQVRAVRHADGSDNFSGPLLSVLDHLRREVKKSGGEASKLVRILRQTPPIVMKRVAVTLEEEGDGSAASRILDFVDGEVKAENPNVSLREKTYLLDVRLLHADRKTEATLHADVDLTARTVQADAAFAPPLELTVRGQQLEVKGARFRSDEFAELNLGRISLANPLADRRFLKAALAEALTRFGAPQYAARLDRIFAAEDILDQAAATLASRTAELEYPKGIWEDQATRLKRYLRDVSAGLLAGTEGERLVFDSCRILYMAGRTEAQHRTDKLKLWLDKRGSRLAEVTLFRVADTGQLRADFNVLSPGQALQVSGRAQKDGQRLVVHADLAASLAQPAFQAKASFVLEGGAWQTEMSLQAASADPQFALAADVLVKDSAVSGAVEGSFTVPGVVNVQRVKATMDKGAWAVDVNGTARLPAEAGDVQFSASLDEKSGIKRCSAVSPREARLPLPGYDLLFKKARLGRDGVVHVEEAALVPAGQDRGRAVIQIADVALSLTRTGKELLALLADLRGDTDLEALAASLVSTVQVVEPVVVLRQPASLRAPGEADEEETSDDLADKMADALGDQAAGAVLMYEPYRRLLASLVLGTGQSVAAFVKTMVKLGDRFPLERVEVKQGRFEYSDAVSPQDRFLSDLSDFNAVIGKSRRAGALGGKFTVDAAFSTAVGSENAGSSLKAEVDLATGDLSGELKVEKLALFPYRFLLPAFASPTRHSVVENAFVGFAYQADADRFAVWGNARLAELGVVSPRISTRPIEHLTLDLTAGTDDRTGLLFDLSQKRLSTGAPVSLGFGRLNRITVEGEIVAANAEFPKFDLRVNLADTPVNDLLGSIPREMADAMSGMSVMGDFGASLQLQADSANLNDLVFSFSPRENGVKLESPGAKVDFNQLLGVFRHRPPSARGDAVLTVGEGDDWVPLDRISPWLVLAVTTCEDGSFFRHSGFNTFQIKTSIIRDLEKGRFARGGSTITMQLVKNLFLSHEKTLSRKLQEIILAWLIEKEIRKERMIEIYLNIIEWGKGIYGVKQACDFYFDGLPPESLNPGHAAFLASFVPSPRPFSEKFKDGGRDPKKRSAAFLRFWENRLKIVRRIVRAMVNNCNAIATKCPSDVAYCKVLETACTLSRRELAVAEAMPSLDVLFKPREGQPPPVGESVGDLLEL